MNGQELQAQVEGVLNTLQSLSSLKGAPPEAQKAFQDAAQSMQDGLSILMGGGQPEASPEAPQEAPPEASGARPPAPERRQFIG
jgi:hypothetical protein